MCFCVHKCVCSLNYPLCKGHAPYYSVIYGLSNSTIHLRYLINNTTFEKKKTYLTQKVYFDFLYKLCSKYFYFKKNSAKYYHKCKCL